MFNLRAQEAEVGRSLSLRQAVKVTIKNKMLMKIYFNKKVTFQPQQEAELGSSGHMVLVLEARIHERSYGLTLQND